MRILHLLSQFEVTGAEVYAAQLAEWQLAKGHSVWIVSDTFSTPTQATYISRPIGQKGMALRWANAGSVRRLIQEQGIQVVHAHSRAASKVGLWAVAGTEAVLVSTVHGRQHWHGRWKRYDVYGQAVIAVCGHIATHLQKELHLNPKKIQVISNGVAFGPYASEGSGDPVLLLAGRTTGPKGELTAMLLARHAEGLLTRFPTLQLHLAGGSLDHLPLEGREAFSRLHQQFGERVLHLAFVRDLQTRVAQARAVIGSGRVAIEALGAGTPLYAAGEATAPGRILPENWQEAASSNFGDVACERKAPGPALEALVNQLAADLLNPPDRIALQGMAQEVRRFYDLEAVAESVMEIYRKARVRKLRPGYIPTLMYHKVPLEPIDSQHRIFVTKDTLEHQLKQLKKRGFTGITFSQYDRWRNGESGATLPEKPVVLTFDDGYLDNYTNAWPLLKQYGFPAVIYALGDARNDHNSWDTPSGEPRMPLMSAVQKQEMAAAGIEFGAHTMNHARLTELDAEQAFQEIAESRKALQALTGQDVLSFAYPYGAYTPEIKALVAKAGFRYGVVISGGGLDWEEDLLEIFRVYVFPEDRGTAFWKKSSPWYRAYFRRKRGV